MADEDWSLWWELEAEVRKVSSAISARSWRDAIDALDRTARLAKEFERKIREFGAEESLLGKRKEPQP